MAPERAERVEPRAEQEVGSARLDTARQARESILTNHAENELSDESNECSVYTVIFGSCNAC